MTNMTATTDFTSVYSTQAALETDPDNPRNRWFVHSLARVSSLLLAQDRIHVLTAPSLDERKRIPLPIMYALGNDLLSTSKLNEAEAEQYRADAKEYFRQHRAKLVQLIDTLATDDLFNTWLDWHRRKEFLSHTQAAGNLVSKDFEDEVKDAGFNLNSEEGYTLDVLIRGRFYCKLNPLSWLHDIRLRLPGLEERQERPPVKVINSKVLALLIGETYTQKGLLDDARRLAAWVQNLRRMREFFGLEGDIEDGRKDATADFTESELHDLAVSLGIQPGSFVTVLDKGLTILKGAFVIGGILSAHPNVVEAAAKAGGPGGVTVLGFVPLLAYGGHRAASAIQGEVRDRIGREQRRHVATTIETGERVLRFHAVTKDE